MRRTTRDRTWRGRVGRCRLRAYEVAHRGLGTDRRHLGSRELRRFCVPATETLTATLRIADGGARLPIMLGEHLADLAPVVLLVGMRRVFRRAADGRVQGAPELVLVDRPSEGPGAVGPVMDERPERGAGEDDVLVLGVSAMDGGRDDEPVRSGPEVAVTRIVSP